MVHRLFTIIALLGLVPLGACATDHSQPMGGHTRTHVEYSSASIDSQMIRGNRTVVGTVESVTPDNIKLNIGELQPLFLSMNVAKEKGFSAIRPGDKLNIVLNDQNSVVDFHPVDQQSHHRQILGQLAQSLTVGHEQAVIRTEDGQELSFAIRPLARSKVASIPIGGSAMFLIDETNQITDVALVGTPSKALRKSPPKGAQQRVEGIIVERMKSNEIRIKTQDGEERPYEIRPAVKDKLSGMSEEQVVILLLDDDNKVVDVAIPPQQKN